MCCFCTTTTVLGVNKKVSSVYLALGVVNNKYNIGTIMERQRGVAGAGYTC